MMLVAFVFAHQYGGEEHLDAPPRELLLAQTEDYVEYSRHGAVLKGLEKAVARSKYEEDVLINNHTVRIWEHAVGFLLHLLCTVKLTLVCFLVHLGLLLEGRLLGIQVLSLHGQTELLHGRNWSQHRK